MTKRTAVAPEIARSGKRPKVVALQIPSGSASAQAISMAVTVSSNVFRARTHNSGATGLL